MLLKLYDRLNTKVFNEIEVKSISDIKKLIEEKETLSKFQDKIKSVNAFLFKELDDFKPSVLEFSWIDIDGKKHSGVDKLIINAALKKLISLKIPFLVFKTQHENCYKIICHVKYLNDTLIDYDEYRQINERFQKYIFELCQLPDYEEGSCSPTKGFCLSKNGLLMFNENEKPFPITFTYKQPVKALPAQASTGLDLQKTEREKFEYALKYVTTDICPDFNSWTRCAMALNATFGESGLAYFEVISTYYGDKQSQTQIEKKYRACKNASRVSIGSVYQLIKDAGIQIDWSGLYPKSEKINFPAKTTPAPQKKEVQAKKKEAAIKFSDAENSYYFQLHSFFSIPEFKELLIENGIDESKFKIDYDKSNNVIVEKNGIELSINQVFAESFEAFTKVCTQKHFPLYKDVIDDKFSFNFTTEEMTAWLSIYPSTIFRNFEYNRAVHAIEPKVKNAEHFVIDRTIVSKIENLYASSLNVQEKNFKTFKPKLLESILTFSANFESQKISENIKQNNGWIDDVLKQGKAYFSSHEKCFTDEDYFMNALMSIFTITEEDYVSLISFIINSIRVRLYGDSQAMRVMIVTGDSGIGKDSFLQGACTGLNYRDADKYILRGALKGATGFAAAEERDMKAIMYNYISDDLSAANGSTNLDTITSPRLPLEVKGSTQKFIPKRFNTIITNNSTHVLFGKDKDHNAIARRTNFLSLKYAKGCNSTDYMKFYHRYNGQFDGFWAGFFTYCFELEKMNNEVIMLSDRAREYTLSNLHKLFYQANDDNRIIDFLTSIYEGAEKEDGLMLNTKNEFLKSIKTKGQSRIYLIIRSVSEYWKRDNKFSGDAIKKAVAAHIDGALLNHSYRNENNEVKTAAMMIPIDYFAGTQEVVMQQVEDCEKVDLIKNFEKYI